MSLPAAGGRRRATVGELLDRGAAEIRRSDKIDHWQEDAPRLDAESFLTTVADTEDHQATVPGAKVARYEEMIRRRAAGEPSARILGYVDFLDFEVRIREGAFFPRISSETMATEAIRRLRGRRRAIHVDLATGVGPVALATARSLPRARVTGVDLLPAAVEGARANARRLGLRNATFLLGDLFEPLPPRLAGGVDVITIHPPYVGREELEEIPEEISRFEPAVTLTDFSPDGLGMVRTVVERSPEWLEPTGWLLIEIGEDMGRRVSGIMRRAGYRDLSAKRDPYGVTKVIAGRRPR